MTAAQIYELGAGDLVSQPFPGYELLDSGQQTKLERIGGHLVERPSPQAIWRRRLSAESWEEVHSRCLRSRDGGGFWEYLRGEPGDLWAEWSGPVATCRFRLGFTGFGHCGMFPEQAPVWAWLQQRVQQLSVAGQGERPRLANLFAYTGCGSVAMAAAGAEVFHVDSAKGILSWAEDNVRSNPQLPGSVRCIHEDARAFLRFGLKRGFRYHGIVMDPPAWGHGKGKETWTIDSDLMELLDLAVACLEPGGFLHCSCHSPGVQEAALVACLSQVGRWQQISHGEFTLAHADPQDPRLLPAGMYVCGEGLR
ncbi:MAG: oxidoreductase [Planctomycetota bacterium]|nr:MAG: oxidoreductase [Planctomycetota bacterium]